MSHRGTVGRSAQPARAGSGPLHGRHRAIRFRCREAREEAGREECRGARVVDHCGDGGGARAVAYRVRPLKGEADPPQFACDGSVAHRPGSIAITRRVTAPGALTRGSEAVSPRRRRPWWRYEPDDKDKAAKATRR